MLPCSDWWPSAGRRSYSRRLAGRRQPLPERWFAGVERGVPIGIPRKQVGVFLEALREVRLTETFEQGGVGAVRLGDELRRRMVIFLLAPVHRDLCFGDLRPLRCCHRFLLMQRMDPQRA